MFKIVLFVKRKTGLSLDAFKARYESGHAPLALATLPRLRRYTRNFLLPREGQVEMDFDCVTEFWFDDRDAYEQTTRFVKDDPEQILARDEAEFMDRSSMRMYFVEECTSPAR